MALAAAGLLAPLHAMAVSIEYTATNLAGTVWRYDYTITNDTGSMPGSADIEAFQIFFDYTGDLYANLGLYDYSGAAYAPVCPGDAAVTAPSAWNTATTWNMDCTVDTLGSMVVFQPDSGFALDGVLDGQALPGPGIADGASLGGFSISFDWFGEGDPGAQLFSIYDPEDFGTALAPPALPRRWCPCQQRWRWSALVVWDEPDADRNGRSH
jgi:hypothetical protein